jgi:hypothetical protein
MDPMVESEVRRRSRAGLLVLLSFGAVAIARGEAPRRAAPMSAQTPFEPGAPGAGPQLEWRAPSSCPQREVVLSHVAVLAAKDDVSWVRFQLIRGLVEPAGDGWRLVLEFVGGESARKRVMQSEGCAELAEAAAVAIVLAHRTGDGANVEWDAAPPPATGSEAQRAGTGAMSAGSPAPRPGEPEGAGGVRPSELADDEAPHTALSAGAEATLDPTTLGAAAFGASVGLELRSGAWSASLYGAGFPPVTSRLGAVQGVEIGLWTAGVRGCHGWRQGLDACVLAELGQVTARGVELDQAREGRDGWVAPGLSLGLRSTPFDGFGVTTRISVLCPLIRGRFRVDDSDVVHRIPFLGFRAALGIDVPLL